MNPTDAIALIIELAPLAKAHGIRKFKLGELEVEYAPSKADPTELQSFNRLMDKGLPTEAQVLFHSSPYGIPTDEEMELLQPKVELPKSVRGRRKMQFSPTETPKKESV